MVRLIQIASLAAVAFIVTSGCSNSNQPPLGTVSGVVTLDDAPYPNANVVFTPAKGRPSVGLTDGSGRYELNYLPETKGAELGEHTVSITTNYQAPESGKEVNFKEPLPVKYHENSTLSATVVAGSNKHDFPLTSK